jgi:hypothetical protein
MAGVFQLNVWTRIFLVIQLTESFYGVDFLSKISILWHKDYLMRLAALQHWT